MNRRGRGGDGQTPLSGETVHKRRRAWLIASAIVLVVLLLVAALVSMLLLRQSPPVNPRWIPSGDAVALLHVQWTSQQDPMLRDCFETAYQRAGVRAPDARTVWTSFKFFFHPELTVWVFPGSETDSAGAYRSRPEAEAPASRWMTMLSLRRRHSLFTRRIEQLLRSVGMQSPEAAASASRERSAAIIGGLHQGALLLSNDSEYHRDALESLQSAKSLAVAPDPDPLSDDLWQYLPGDKMAAFVVRDPARRFGNLLRKYQGRTLSAEFITLESMLPALFADAPRLYGWMTYYAGDRLETQLRWSASANPQTARDQRQALNMLAMRWRQAFPLGDTARWNVAVASDLTPGELGVTILLENFSAVFALPGR